VARNLAWTVARILAWTVARILAWTVARILAWPVASASLGLLLASCACTFCLHRARASLKVPSLLGIVEKYNIRNVVCILQVVNELLR
jgi:hypothetical protein